MSKIINIYEAKTNFSKLVEMAEAGEEFIIGRNGKPVARLVPMESPRRGGVKFGVLKGKIRMLPGFDDPLPADIQAAFEGDGT
jgi:prevent-host-death family protein